MKSRITFGAELRYAMHVRGLSLTEVARLAGVTVATASSAAIGRPVNVTTAVRVARAVATRPIVPELLEWVQRPDPTTVGLRAGQDPAPSSGAPRSANGRSGGPPRRSAASTPRQLRIAVD
jgi:transcriptional regulator with XRE-family HTH domain